MYKVLIVEDIEAVADLQVLKLVRAGIVCEARRVETPEAFRREVERFSPDVILCGASVPQLSCRAALALADSLCPETAFIFVFKTGAEESSLEALLSEAGERVRKTNPLNLPWTFERAVRATADRRTETVQDSAIARLKRLCAGQARELELLRSQHLVLGKFSRYLKASQAPPEIYAALETFGPQLFPGGGGKLYLSHPPGKHLEAVASWGDGIADDLAFTIEDCWALRLARIHSVASSGTELACGHVAQDQKAVPPYACLPLFAQGEILGLLHLRGVPQGPKSRDVSPSLQPDLDLAAAVAEEASLALRNLKVREILHEQSIRDPLTGLYNRRFLEEFLMRELARADRKKQSLSVITLDIDHFKQINDTFGHGAGDIVLRRVALLLQGYVRQSDIACRAGGEEFVVLLPEASAQIAAQRAEGIRSAVRELKLKYEDRGLSAITISLGVAAFPENGTTPDALIRAADRALYDAKYGGRDRVASA